MATGGSGGSATGSGGAGGAATGGSGGAEPDDFVLGTPETLASDLAFPIRIAADASHVYWGARALSAAGTPVPGAVQRVALSGGPVEDVVPNEPAPAGVALEGDTVFWTNTNPGQLRRARRDGTEVTTLFAPTGRLSDFALTQQYFFVSQISGASTGVHRIDRISGASALLTASYTLRFAVDGDTVYFTDRGDLRTPTGRVYVLESNAEAPDALAENLAAPEALALSGGALFYATNGTGPEDGTVLQGGGVHELTLPGGARRTLATSDNEPFGVGADSKYVYFTERSAQTAGEPGSCDTDTGRLMALPRTGGPPMAVVSGLRCPSSIVVRDTAVLFVSNGDSTTSTGGSVVRIPKLPAP